MMIVRLNLVSFLLIIISLVRSVKSVCDSTCISSLSPDDCPVGTFFEVNITMNDCCPGCRTGIEWGASGCDNKSKRCSPGLQCDPDFYCILDRESCIHTQHLGSEIGWRPSCDNNGNYMAKQCRGDKVIGRCFCYTEAGQRVFGWDWWKNADDMTCACSRQRAKLEAGGRLDVSLHCMPNGNFEDLQCDMGICWCAEQGTGHLLHGTFAVPQSLWTYLPCYDKKVHGDQYLRKCESASYAQRILQKAFINRGAVKAVPNLIECNYDGSFGFYMIENSLAYCQTAEGSKMEQYSTPSKMLSEMDCKCGHDKRIFQNAGIAFSLICNPNGNYEPVQDQNGKMFCVDRDGFAVTPLMSPQLSLDCDRYIYTAQEDIFDEDIDIDTYDEWK